MSKQLFISVAEKASQFLNSLWFSEDCFFVTIEVPLIDFFDSAKPIKNSMNTLVDLVEPLEDTTLKVWKGK